MEDPKTVVTEQPQAPVVTPEQQLTALMAEKEKLTKELEEANKAKATIGQNLRKREADFNKQQALESKIESLAETQKLLAAYLAERESGSANDFEEAKATRKPDLLKQFEELETKRKANEAEAQQKAQIEQFTSVVSGYEQRAVALGLTENDEAYWDIKGLVETAYGRPDNLRRADIKLKKLEEGKVAKTETEEQRIDRMVEERLRKKMDETGMLKPEGGAPSGTSSSFKQTEQLFIDGKVSSEQYTKARKEAGLI